VVEAKGEEDLVRKEKGTKIYWGAFPAGLFCKDHSFIHSAFW
jgi:hypothetical protein